MSESQEIKLPVGEDRVKIFDNLKEVRDFVESERKAFSWLTSENQYDWDTNHPSNLANKVGQQYSRIENRVEQALGSDDPDVRSIRSRFSQAYELKGLVYSKSPKGEYIDKLREEEGDEYAALVYFYMSGLASDNRVRDLRASFEANLYLRDLSNNENGEERSLEALQNEWEEKYNRSIKEAEQQIDEVVKSKEERFTELESKQEELQESVSNKDERFNTLLYEAGTELENLTDEYRDQIALLAPVEYWEDKADTHGNWSIVWGVAVSIVGGLLGWGFITQAQNVLGAEGEPNYAELVVLLTIATLGIWGIRLLVKLLLSNVRLQRDARERSVMLESFLAMLREGHIDPEEKETILATLFRPAQYNSLDGDSTPNNAAGILSRVFSSK